MMSVESDSMNKVVRQAERARQYGSAVETQLEHSFIWGARLTAHWEKK